MKKSFKFGVIGFFLLSLGIFLQNCESNKAVNKNEKTDWATHLKGVWHLSTIEGVKANEVFEGTIPNINFDFSSKRVTGNGGCNNYNGGFTILENVYTPTPMASTRMLCTKPNQENKFLNLIGKSSTLVLSNQTLQFIQEGKVVLEFTNNP